MNLLNSKNLKKVYRYTKALGISRTFVKICGRLRTAKYIGFFLFPNFSKKHNDVAIIGCGQFAFSTIGYFLKKYSKHNIRYCYDTNSEAAKSFSEFYRCQNVSSIDTILKDKNIKFVYVASNHYTHTQYATEALKNGKYVHIEKPISVSPEQFEKLLKEIKPNIEKTAIGYNRPFSEAIKAIDLRIKDNQLPLSISSTICGHKIPPSHWYRNREEGTRICGNIGHWIDMSVHLMNTRGAYPNIFDISILQADESEIDDNLAISISTDKNDIISIFLTSREEPLEGINEEIVLQSGNITAKIDDFRSIEIWNGTNYWKKKFFPKDVGHKKCILQLTNGFSRDFNEVVVSTIIMLKIMHMAKNRIKSSKLFLKDEMQKYETNTTIV